MRSVNVNTTSVLCGPPSILNRDAIQDEVILVAQSCELTSTQINIQALVNVADDCSSGYSEH